VESNVKRIPPFRVVGDALRIEMNKRNGRWKLKELAAVAAASVALLAGTSAWGLGLGRLAVQSALGEPLRAEIDVTSLTPEEAAALRVRVAPPESYRVAGIDYNPVLPATSVALQRRADGTAFLRVLSDRPVQEPFVDLILELTWSSGRLLREYTLLFDPPTSRAAGMSTAAVATAPAVAIAPPTAMARVPSSEVVPANGDNASRASSSQARDMASDREPAPAKAARAARPEPRPDADAAGDGSKHQVKRGETLSAIAQRYQGQSVSLDQMLVSLYRGNKRAFIGGNMNRLRSGASRPEARRVIQAQSADFNRYRQRLAGAVPKASEAEPSRKQSGKVEAEVQDRKQAVAAVPDRLTLDKGRPSAAASAVEDKVARERADKEASARVQELSRNLDELKKLQAASGTGAGMAASGSGIGVPIGMVPPESAKASMPDFPQIPVAASVPPVPVMASGPDIPPAPPAPVVPTPAAPIAAGDGEAAQVSWLDSLTENPMVLPGAGILIALLAAFGWYRLRGRNKEEAGVTSFLESRLQPDSFFGASGGQRVDTRDASGTPSSMSYSLSQIDAIGDVDPVAEADVYLAYGRDLQAEEILKEAMRADPERLAVRTKLLEVYAKRRDAKGFEALAGELYGLTKGQGEEWAKAQEMGRSIDPENPLYEPGGSPSPSSGAASMASHEVLGASTMPQSVVPAPGRFENSVAPDLSLDDLAADGSSAVDLDISFPGADDIADRVSGFTPSRPSGLSGLDSGGNSLKFELSDMPSVAASPRIDLGDISLDLDAPLTNNSAAGDLSSAPLDLPGDDDDSDPLARKLELAEEFRQIGDLEGARDLLQEVVEKADGALRSRAQAMLDNLA
jgi:pilus assembly protein FimV